jgi:hypothetical protein
MVLRPPRRMWRCHLPEHLVEGRERCWVIRLPDPAHWWHTNGQSSKEGEGFWIVRGEPPKLTVKPSINMVGSWHGWITDGELSPEVGTPSQS